MNVFSLVHTLVSTPFVHLVTCLSGSIISQKQGKELHKRVQVKVENDYHDFGKRLFPKGLLNGNYYMFFIASKHFVRVFLGKLWSQNADYRHYY